MLEVRCFGFGKRSQVLAADNKCTLRCLRALDYTISQETSFARHRLRRVHCDAVGTMDILYFRRQLSSAQLSSTQIGRAQLNSDSLALGYANRRNNRLRRQEPTRSRNSRRLRHLSSGSRTPTLLPSWKIHLPSSVSLSLSACMCVQVCF